MLPLVINTVANCYKNICIIGSGSLSEELYSYLVTNEGITVTHIKEDKDGARVSKGTEIVIYTFDYTAPAVDEDGQPVYSVSYKNLTENKIHPFDDIYQNIIPFYQKNGVECILVTTPNLRNYKQKIRLFLSMMYFALVQKYSKDRDRKLIHHLRQDSIYEDFMKTKADSAKGYLRVYGNSDTVNYDDGFRRIPCDYVISKDAPNLYFFGFCISANPMMADKDTIAARLQDMCGDRYRVLSRGNNGASINLVMRDTRYRKGDVVILYTSHKDEKAYKCGAKVIGLTDIYCSVKKLWKHMTDSSFHCDPALAKMIADRVLGTVKELPVPSVDTERESLVFGTPRRLCPSIGMVPEGLRDYIKATAEKIPEEAKRGGKTGAVVMNCNPFTYGHKYLVEQVSAKVDNLIIFVVQENKSVFKFKDRFDMVKEGVKEFGNVHVVPSGEYIISSSTLPGYFDKKHLGNISVSAGEDLEMFAVICNELGISVRFAGSEPNDAFTNSYNVAMSRTLPLYGIDFVEIPRVTRGDGVISATKVRALMDEKKYAELKELLPETSYNILGERGYIESY